ncbi:MAG: hypothetical protein H7123_09165 [Thermoleophilia bacterium]|nr:hypothetical protein [Thermoleophilia bacterium]
MTDAPELIAIAHDIASMHNVGAIYRTADGAGCTTVISSGFTGTPPDPRIAKVALGAELKLATETCPTLPQLLTRLTDTYVVLAEQDTNSVSYDQIELAAVAQREIAVIVCDELNGAPPALRERADLIVELPMAGSKESLNVSVAFGIVMYAVASAARRAAGGLASEHLRSRTPSRPVRNGVLTRGRTRSELPQIAKVAADDAAAQVVTKPVDNRTVAEKFPGKAANDRI